MANLVYRLLQNHVQKDGLPVVLSFPIKRHLFKLITSKVPNNFICILSVLIGELWEGAKGRFSGGPDFCVNAHRRCGNELAEKQKTLSNNKTTETGVW